MKLLLVSVSSALLLAGATPKTCAQAFTSQLSPQDLAGVFTKVKDKVKDKDGVHTEVHLNVSSQPWVAAAPTAYAGTYEAEGLGFKLTVAALPSGQLTMSGADPAADGLGPDRPVSFTNVRVQDGLLIATKTDEYGIAQLFTAAFLTQSRNGVVTHGIGTKLAKPVTLNDCMVLEKLFYQKQR